MSGKSLTILVLGATGSIGRPVVDLAPVFAALATDPPGAIDGVQDPDTQPLAQEPARVQADLQSLWAR